MQLGVCWTNLSVKYGMTPVCVSEILLAHSLTIHLSVQATVVGLGNYTGPLCPAIPKILSTWVIVNVC